jgi:flagellar biosynthesis/type III secretory pathway M-ring protein FliF/YscJ
MATDHEHDHIDERPLRSQMLASLLVALAIVAVVIVAVRAQLGTTSVAEQEAAEERREQRLEAAEEAREERIEAAEEAAEN